MGHNMQAVLTNPPVDGQIHTRNPKGLAERDLLYQAHAKHAVMKFLDVLIEDAVTAVEFESGTGGTRTWM